MEIKVQATQPGKKNSSHSGAVIRYSTPATSTLLRRQEKCVACQVPAASPRLTRSSTSAINSSTALGWAPGMMAATATSRCST